MFKVARIGAFTPGEREAYEEGLKYYRDIKSVVDTSREETTREFVKGMLAASLPVDRIRGMTGLDRDEIERMGRG